MSLAVINNHNIYPSLNDMIVELICGVHRVQDKGSMSGLSSRSVVGTGVGDGQKPTLTIHGFRMGLDQIPRYIPF